MGDTNDDDAGKTDVYLPVKLRNIEVLVQTSDGEYLVDNSVLKAPTKGIGFRRSKSIANVFPTGECAAWGSTIQGADDGDGWIKTQAFIKTVVRKPVVADAVAQKPVVSEEVVESQHPVSDEVVKRPVRVPALVKNLLANADDASATEGTPAEPTTTSNSPKKSLMRNLLANADNEEEGTTEISAPAAEEAAPSAKRTRLSGKTKGAQQALVETKFAAIEEAEKTGVAAEASEAVSGKEPAETVVDVNTDNSAAVDATIETTADTSTPVFSMPPAAGISIPKFLAAAGAGKIIPKRIPARVPNPKDVSSLLTAKSDAFFSMPYTEAARKAGKCEFYPIGVCTKGDECQMYHDLEERCRLLEDEYEMRKSGTKCAAYIAGTCSNGHTCADFHDVTERCPIVSRKAKEEPQAAEEELEEGRWKGVVKKFDWTKGFGFITSDLIKEKFGKDMFVLKSEMEGGGFDQGMEVTFEISISEKTGKENAVQLRRPGEKAPAEASKEDWNATSSSSQDQKSSWDSKADDKWKKEDDSKADDKWKKEDTWEKANDGGDKWKKEEDSKADWKKEETWEKPKEETWEKPKGEVRAGDWPCPDCGNNVFARKTACPKCGAAKPDENASWDKKNDGDDKWKKDEDKNAGWDKKNDGDDKWKKDEEKRIHPSDKANTPYTYAEYLEETKGDAKKADQMWKESKPAAGGQPQEAKPSWDNKDNKADWKKEDSWDKKNEGEDSWKKEDRGNDNQSGGGEAGTGTLVRWNDEKKFGFIKPDDGGDDLFVHHSSLTHGAGSVTKDDAVKFTKAYDDKKSKWKALDVEKAEGSSGTAQPDKSWEKKDSWDAKSDWAKTTTPSNNNAGGNDDAKNTLVTKIKDLQRSNPEAKQAWIDMCDQDLGGNRDPNRHGMDILESFAKSWGVGSAASSSHAGLDKNKFVGDDSDDEWGGWAPAKENPQKKAKIADAVPEDEESDPTVVYVPMMVKNIAVMIKKSATTYLVDNSVLKAPTKGVGYRSVKIPTAVFPSGLCAIWGTIIVGSDEGDGWLKTKAVPFVHQRTAEEEEEQKPIEEQPSIAFVTRAKPRARPAAAQEKILDAAPDAPSEELPDHPAKKAKMEDAEDKTETDKVEKKDEAVDAEMVEEKDEAADADKKAEAEGEGSAETKPETETTDKAVESEEAEKPSESKDADPEAA